MCPVIIGRLSVLGEMLEEYLPLHVEYLNDVEVHHYLHLRPPFTLEGQRAWLQEVTCSESDLVFALLAREQESGCLSFIGVTGLHEIDLVCRTARSGTIIGNKHYWGRGIGTEAKFLQLWYAFTVLGLQWVRSSTVASNVRSRGFLENAGYREVGVRPRARLIDGSYQDEVLYGVSREMWKSSWNTYFSSCH